MHAIVTTPFKGRRDSDSHVSDLVAGDRIDGDLATVAVREGWAEEIDEDTAAMIDAMTQEERAAMKAHAAAATAPPQRRSKGRRSEGEEQ